MSLTIIWLFSLHYPTKYLCLPDNLSVFSSDFIKNFSKSVDEECFIQNYFTYKYMVA